MLKEAALVGATIALGIAAARDSGVKRLESPYPNLSAGQNVGRLWTPESASTPIIIPTTVAIQESGSEVTFATVTPIPEPISSVEQSDSSLVAAEKSINHWYEFMPPDAIEVPSVKLSSSLIHEDKTPHNGYNAPDYGIGTPSEVFANSIYIFGHSRWLNEIQPMSKIQNINLGDKVKIMAGPLFASFVVTEFKLYDYADTFYWPKNQSLILQTSASVISEETGNTNWLLNKDLVYSKLTQPPNIISGHTAFLVIAVPER